MPSRFPGSIRTRAKQRERASERERERERESERESEERERERERWGGGVSCRFPALVVRRMPPFIEHPAWLRMSFRL
jgi:hypothetical protein